MTKAQLLAEIEQLRASLERERATRLETDKTLAGALEQQTATTEILRVISNSHADLSQAGATILANAARLCEAELGNLFVYDRGAFCAVAHHNASQPFRDVLSGPLQPGPETGIERLRAAPTPFQIADVRATEAYRNGEPYAVVGADLEGIRTLLAVPFARDGRLVGVITIYRREIRPFTPKQIELVKTFADQAVIAIENVRLFTELQARNADLTEALEQQTATSEILSVISSSPTDVQPVFDAIVRNAARLCAAASAGLNIAEGDVQRKVAEFGSDSFALRIGDTRPIARTSIPGRAMLEGRTTYIADIRDPVMMREYPDFPYLPGPRAYLATPLLREGSTPVGVLVMFRTDGEPFTERHGTLLKTFADQAVIAIENVRLFTELQVSNRDLTQALDKQTATSDILRVISQSQTDVQPVFDTIITSAVRLLRGHTGALTRLAGDQIVLVAHTSVDDASDASLRAFFPQSLHSERPHAAAVRQRAPINIADTQSDPEIPEPLRAIARARGYHGWVIVPMLRQDEAIGTIAVTRGEAGGFTDDEIALLQTFAAQAVIAIENVRLFTELQEKNQALTQAHAQVTESLEQQTATAEILRVISSSPTDVQPVFDAIARSAVRLCEGVFGGVLRVEGNTLHLVADHNFTPEARAVYRQVFPIALTQENRRNVSARTVIDRTIVHLSDIRQEPDFAVSQRLSEALKFRAILSVPMVRDDSVIGAISVARAPAGAFSEGQVELLKTFADQAVIAIENVRLFTELEVANRQLKAASQHKSEFLANMSHELRTPLNAVIGFSEVLSEKMFGELNEKQEEYSKDIHASGQHLLSLINDILDLSKIEAGRMELELTDFHLPTALDSALTLVRERAGRRSIALQMNVDERLGEVRADERKIRQVVLNLLSNAIKFTPEGGSIEVRAVPKDGSVEVSVSDTGVGIAPEDHEAVFEEFRQVGTAAKKVEGTGLGLTLCRKFIELHGGRIWVTSQVGAGSTFTFTIPVRRGE